jgi:hypothetical protein
MSGLSVSKQFNECTAEVRNWASRTEIDKVAAKVGDEGMRAIALVGASFAAYYACKIAGFAVGTVVSNVLFYTGVTVAFLQVISPEMRTSTERLFAYAKARGLDFIPANWCDGVMDPTSASSARGPMDVDSPKTS